jgi:hypothetical protein
VRPRRVRRCNGEALSKPKTSGHAARAAYEKALAKHPGLAGVRVAEQTGRVTFSRVPLASVALFAGVIAKVDCEGEDRRWGVSCPRR